MVDLGRPIWAAHIDALPKNSLSAAPSDDEEQHASINPQASFLEIITISNIRATDTPFPSQPTAISISLTLRAHAQPQSMTTISKLLIIHSSVILRGGGGCRGGVKIEILLVFDSEATPKTVLYSVPFNDAQSTSIFTIPSSIPLRSLISTLPALPSP